MPDRELPMPRRRQSDSDQTDADAQLKADQERWVRFLLQHRATAMMIAGALGSLFTLFVSSVGFKVWGPPQQLSAAVQAQARTDSQFAKADSVLVVRVTRLELGAMKADSLYLALDRKLGLSLYVQCWNAERQAAGTLPAPGCKQILDRGLP